jgi:glycosyltransferase involved in cell wall biosynthesis
MSPQNISEPLISVILPVYNGGPYLKEAILSVLEQSHRNLELIVIDDGSKDDSAATVRAFDDPRIRFSSQANEGLARTLNKMLAQAKGDFVARQDQDDISHPSRLETQLAYLQTHPELSFVGSWSEIISVDGARTGRGHEHPRHPDAVRFLSLFDSPFVHPSVMFRREIFQRHAPYSYDPRRQPEDLELWMRLLRHEKAANIPDKLLLYREVPSGMSREGRSKFEANLLNLSLENFRQTLGILALESLYRPLIEAYRGIPLSSRPPKMLLRVYYRILKHRIFGFDHSAYREVAPYLESVESLLRSPA